MYILINALQHFLVANLLVANLPKSQNNKKLGLPQEVCHKVCHNGWGFATKAFFEFPKISSSILRTRFVDIWRSVLKCKKSIKLGRVEAQHWAEMLIFDKDYHDFRIARSESKSISQTTPRNDKYSCIRTVIKKHAILRIRLSWGVNVDKILNITSWLSTFSQRLLWVQSDVANCTREGEILTYTNCH
jgi:hypothetical protein